MEIKDRIIVALDVDSLEKAKPLVESLAFCAICSELDPFLVTKTQALKCDMVLLLSV